MPQSTPPSIVVFGGINIDLVTYARRFPQPGETVVGSRFLSYGGGKGANQAVATARLGARVRLFGRVGDDAFGEQLLAGLRGYGVDVGGVGVTPRVSSGVASINVDEATGQNRIIQVPGANAACDSTDAKGALDALPEAAALLLQLEAPPELSSLLAKRGKELGKLVVLDPGPVKPIPPELWPCVSVITPNETEAEALVGFPIDGLAAAQRAADILLTRGVGCAVIKMGAQGAYYATPEGRGRIQPFPVKAVDSVAAGDAFNGALAVWLTESRPLAEAARAGAAAGALAVTRVGAFDSMPARGEVEALLGSVGPS